MRVLVVEDSASVRQRMVAIFKRADEVEAVAEAETGEESLALLGEFRPDLMTLDLMLPGMSGLDVLEELQHEDLPVRVVVFTNYPYPAFRKKCLDLGATQFHAKTMDANRLLALVRNGGSRESHRGPGGAER